MICLFHLLSYVINFMLLDICYLKYQIEFLFFVLIFYILYQFDFFYFDLLRFCYHEKFFILYELFFQLNYTIFDRNFAADYPIFNDFTIPWPLPLPHLYYYKCLVIKALRDFPQFKRFFTICYHIGIQFILNP